MQYQLLFSNVAQLRGLLLHFLVIVFIPLLNIEDLYFFCFGFIKQLT